MWYQPCWLQEADILTLSSILLKKLLKTFSLVYDSGK